MKHKETGTEGTPLIGARYLAPSGHIWTVQSITPRGSRVVITYDAPDGKHGAVVDFTAISKMIALDATPDARRVAPASPPPVQVTTTEATVDTLADAAAARR